MVNGFKGGDWNDLARVLSVRQKHAHSWVEALVGDDRRPAAPRLAHPRPHPGRGARRVGRQVGRLRRRASASVTDLVRYIWVFYVVGFNAERQEQLLYGPIRDARRPRPGGASRSMGESAHGGLAGWLFDFPDVASFFSVRGFVVLVRRSCRWRWRSSWRLASGCSARLPVGRGAVADDAALRRGWPSIGGWSQLLAEFGLDRPPAETQREFARRAAASSPAAASSDRARGRRPPARSSTPSIASGSATATRPADVLATWRPGSTPWRRASRQTS